MNEDLDKEIADLESFIESLYIQLEVKKAKLIRLKGRKEMIDNYNKK